MKKLLLLISLIPSLVFGNCDFSKIVSNPDGTYTYTKELHICVGQMKADLGVANKKLVDLNAAFVLKDQSLTDADKRAEMWKQGEIQTEQTLVQYDKLKSDNQWIMFGLGILTTFAAAYTAHQLSKH